MSHLLQLLEWDKGPVPLSRFSGRENTASSMLTKTMTEPITSTPVRVSPRIRKAIIKQKTGSAVLIKVARAAPIFCTPFRKKSTAKRVLKTAIIRVINSWDGVNTNKKPKLL